MSCHPTQLKQGEDTRPSVKHMSYHPMQSRQGEDARPSIMDTGKSICRLVTSVNHSLQVVRLYSGSTPFERSHTYLVAPWSPLRRQYTKVNLVQSMTDFTLLNYPPILGDGQMTKKCPNLYMNIENNFHIPPVFAQFGGGGGILPILPILVRYWPILLSIMGKKWGDKSFMLLARIIFSHYRPWFI